MSNPAGDQNVAVVTSAQTITEHTRDFAATLYQAVLTAYLAYRRTYYHEANPDLETAPPPNEKPQQTEGAVIAHQMLRALQLLPREIQSIVLIRELLDQLQWEVDIHTLTDYERTGLNNLTRVFLHAIEGGIQPWYVEWLLQSMHNLQHATDPKYYLAFPWHGLFYRSPAELQKFDQAVQKGDLVTIMQEFKQVADSLIAVLHQPLELQPKLAFSGADGERRRTMFRLKTSAGLALGAYLAVEQVQSFLHPRQPNQQLTSVLGPLPQPLLEHLHLIPSDDTATT